MPPQVTLVSKLKVQLKMAIQRLRMLQSKSTAIAKQQRRAMAELLAQGKLESARIRVENIIRSDIGTELHEILELYCELLLARISLLEGAVVPPPLPAPAATPAASSTTSDSTSENTLDSGLDEAIRSILYAAPRCDIKELTTARALLADKFGKEYAQLAAEGAGVPERVLKRVRVETPNADLVDGYLRAIGETYGVRFPGDPEPGLDEDEDEDEADEDGDDATDDNDNDNDEHGGIAASTEPATTTSTPARTAAAALSAPLAAERDLARATPPRDMGETRNPLRIAPPSPTTENPKPSVKLPRDLGAAAAGTAKTGKKAGATSGAGTKTGNKTAAASSGAVATGKDKAGSTTTVVAGGAGPGGTIPNVDELAKRFAALKRG